MPNAFPRAGVIVALLSAIILSSVIAGSGPLDRHRAVRRTDRAIRSRFNIGDHGDHRPLPGRFRAGYTNRDVSEESRLRRPARRSRCRVRGVPDG